MTGYAHPAYAASLAEFGEPRFLPRSEGWILERPIPGTPLRDAMGCYPLFACRDWHRLSEDLEAIDGSLVSLALVTDPFGVYEPEALARMFPDACRPFKEHFVVDLSLDPASFVDAHHRRNARKGLREVDVEPCEASEPVLGDWTRLYHTLIERHAIQGMTAFSERTFRRQLQTPGMMVYRAVRAKRTVGMVLWYVCGAVAYYHLGAYDEDGYRCGASFALFTVAIREFAGMGLRWLSLGAGAGVDGRGTDGLSRFKRGWASGTRTAFFCGRVFDRTRYDALVGSASRNGYFPSYRHGEFS
jgi:hypothetical protein